MKTITTMFVLGGLVLFSMPLYTFAQTFAYVDTSGQLQLETANTAQEAIDNAPNRAVHSGVMVVGNPRASEIVPNDTDTDVYAYVTTSGELSTQIAESAEEAIRLAPNRASDSGVMLIVK